VTGTGGERSGGVIATGGEPKIDALFIDLGSVGYGGITSTAGVMATGGMQSGGANATNGGTKVDALSLDLSSSGTGGSYEAGVKPESDSAVGSSVDAKSDVIAKTGCSYRSISYCIGPPEGALVPPGDVTSAGQFIISEETVQDTITGLLWQRDGKTKRPGCRNVYGNDCTWEEATTYCENLILGGYSDWRIPNMHELISIVDFSKSAPPLVDSEVFPDTLSKEYWTSSAMNVSWGVSVVLISFESGGYWTLVNKLPQNEQVYSYGLVRCVRSEPLVIPNPRFVSISPDLMLDKLTGLQWSKENYRREPCPANYRLPTIKELFSLGSTCDPDLYKIINNSTDYDYDTSTPFRSGESSSTSNWAARLGDRCDDSTSLMQGNGLKRCVLAN
jgi:hypothetical protein